MGGSGCSFEQRSVGALSAEDAGGGPRDGGVDLYSPGDGGRDLISGSDYPPVQPCRNLSCQQTECTSGPCMQAPCAAGVRTTVTGTVYDPAGRVPLYNVMVYVPNDPLADIEDGASCETCATAASGSPVTATLTDEHGRFSLPNAPVGQNIPLVMQIGKWRRQVTLPAVAACTANPVTDVGLTRLPRNKSEGHIPKIALATGGADALECLLRKIGVDDSEFTPESGDGRVNFFAGVEGTSRYADTLNGGASFTVAGTWWESAQNLLRYDMVLLSCDGKENPADKSVTARAAMKQYLDAGGRTFASHWHNYWFEHGPAPLPTVANFHHQDDLPNPFTATIDTTFPKGQALANWLVNVGSTAPLGQITIRAGQHTVDTVNPATTQRWIYSDPTAAVSTPSVQYMTFNTPVAAPAANQCGRAVLSDIHVSSSDQINRPYPSGCRSTTLSDQEKVLEFMIFDLSACVIPDYQRPMPPVIQ
jgi:hypothetical protein